MLNDYFGILEEYIIDNGLANSPNIFVLQEVKFEDDVFVLICNDSCFYYRQIWHYANEPVAAFRLAKNDLIQRIRFPRFLGRFFPWLRGSL